MNNNGETNNVNQNATNNEPIISAVTTEQPVVQSTTDAQPAPQEPVIVSQEPVVEQQVAQEQPTTPEAQPQTVVEAAPNEAVTTPTPEATTPEQQPATEPEKQLSKKELKKLQKEQAKQAKLEKKHQAQAPAPTEPSTNPDGTPVEIQQPQKQGSFFKTLLLLAVIVLIGYTVYTSKTYKAQINKLTYNCTPVTTNKEMTKLDLNSVLVQSLYKKVATTIKEDYAQTEMDNSMRLYLAYRQIPANEKYDSNCNMFDKITMEPYVCEAGPTFVPQAFKIEALELEFKKLFGESTPYELDNIKLGNSCVGGYQYIPERQEFVQGQCPQQTSTPIKVKKELIEAQSYRNTIILVEDVQYKGSDSTEIPEDLKNGKYYYTFKLDMNYNFIYVSKTHEDLNK